MSIPVNKSFTVLHNYLVWLSQTENWIYNQVRFSTIGVRPYVVCKQCINRDLFEWPDIYCYTDIPLWKRVVIGLKSLIPLNIHFRQQAALLCHAASQTGASLVHSHFGYIGYKYAMAIRRMKLKHIVTFYGVDISMLPKQDPVWIKRYQEMFQLIDLVLCEGPHMARCVMSYGCPEHKVKVHHLGICLDDIAFQPRQWTRGQVLKVLIAASFREKKGIPYALEALGRFQNEQELHITIIGDAGQNPETQTQKNEILTIIEKYRLNGRIDLMGYQPHAEMLRQAYRHHVFISPSITASNGDTEGGAPVGLIEMAATGMPVISTTHCDIPEVIQHGVSGLLADEKDIDGLVSHLRWLTQNPDRWKTMAAMARQHIENEFDARRQGERLAGIYHELCDCSGEYR